MMTLDELKKLSDAELNARAAAIVGDTVECGSVLEFGELWTDPERVAIYRGPSRVMVGRAGAGWHPCADANAARELVLKVGDRGLGVRYVRQLVRVVGGDVLAEKHMTYGLRDDETIILLTASPREMTLAAVLAAEGDAK